MLYLFYLSNLFEILGCPLFQQSFSTHAIYKSLQCSVSFSVDLFLSVSLPPLSANSPLYFYLLLFHINTLMIFISVIIE